VTDIDDPDVREAYRQHSLVDAESFVFRSPANGDDFIAAFAKFPGGFGQPRQVITLTPIACSSTFPTSRSFSSKLLEANKVMPCSKSSIRWKRRTTIWEGWFVSRYSVDELKRFRMGDVADWVRGA
jgi:hypothetical protein